MAAGCPALRCPRRGSTRCLQAGLLPSGVPGDIFGAVPRLGAGGGWHRAAGQPCHGSTASSGRNAAQAGHGAGHSGHVCPTQTQRRVVLAQARPHAALAAGGRRAGLRPRGTVRCSDGAQGWSAPGTQPPGWRSWAEGETSACSWVQRCW